MSLSFVFFNDTATTEIYTYGHTLSLHYALPTGWRPFVIRDGVVDRAAYELCALSQLRDRLRAGDIWVAGSRQFRDFDSYLIPPTTFAALRSEEHTSELQSLMRISYAVFCLKTTINTLLIIYALTSSV